MGLASPCPGGWERKPGHTRAINSGETDIQKGEYIILRRTSLCPEFSELSHPTAWCGFCLDGLAFSQLILWLSSPPSLHEGEVQSGGGGQSGTHV